MTLPANAAKEILHGPAYRFCREPSYPWTTTEAEWCVAVGEKNDRCEALPRACQGEMGHAVPGRRGRRGWGEHEEQEKDPFVLHLPQIGALGSYFLWALIAVAIAVVLRLVLSKAFGRRDKSDTSTEPDAAAPSSDDSGVPSEVLSDVQKLIERARRAAAEGRFGDGIGDAYAALLRQLEGERLLRIDPWRTNGDYLRDLSRTPDLRSDVRRVVRTVEAVQFGREAPTIERFDSVFREVSALLSASAARRMRGAVVGAAAIACLAFMLASCGDFLPTRGAEEDSPSGISATVELLRRAGFQPTMRFRSLSKSIDETQVVLLPGAHLDKAAWDSLLDWVNAGGTLVVSNRDPWLATWPGVAFAARPGLRHELTPGGAAPREVREASVVVSGTNEIVIPPSVKRGGNLLHRGESVYAERFDHGEGEVIVLADGRLFTNASLAMADNAAFLLALLQNDVKKIDLVGEFTGSGAKSPLASVERGKLAPVLLQLGLVLILFFLYKGIAFGTLTDPPLGERRNFAEHARALGLLYAKARASAHARSTFGTYALERLRERVLLGDQKGISALAEAVAARSGEPLGRVARVLVEAQEPPSENPKHKDSHEDLDVIRRLSRLLIQSKGGSK
jgi:hypothetical protein